MLPSDHRMSYDMHPILRAIVDDGELLEFQEQLAREMICADARIHGVPVGIIANQRGLIKGRAGEKPRLLVLNKADLLADEERHEVRLWHPDAVLVSAAEGEGLDELRERIEAAFAETLTEVELLIPYSEGGRLHELHEVAGDLERTDGPDGVLVHARVPAAELHRFDDLAVA